MPLWLRLLAGLGLAALCGVLVWVGLWDVLALVLLGAGLGWIMGRPKPGRKFRPSYWTREQNTPAR